MGLKSQTSYNLGWREQFVTVCTEYVLHDDTKPFSVSQVPLVLSASPQPALTRTRLAVSSRPGDVRVARGPVGVGRRPRIPVATTFTQPLHAWPIVSPCMTAGRRKGLEWPGRLRLTDKSSPPLLDVDGRRTRF